MPNEKDVHKIIQRLKEDHDTELMRYELEPMLERELAKPDSEIDVQLVDELLKTLEEDPSEYEKLAAWKSIEKQTQRKAAWRNMSTARRIAASMLILFVVSAISVGSAYAFNWTFLLKFLKPLTETFGIYSANTLNNPQPEQTNAPYDDDDTGYEQVFFSTAEEMPSEWNGLRVQPTWLPERFSFIQGSMYEDDSVAIFSATYIAGESFFNLTTNFFADDEDITTYEYQKTLGDPILEVIAGQEVTYYLNSDTQRLSASWIDQNAHYLVFGDIIEEEMRSIVLSVVE